MNWIVTIQTKTSQIIDVPIRGYIQIEDAKLAALSQTGAATVLYAMPDYSSSSSNSNNSSYASGDFNLPDDMNSLEVLSFCVGAVLFCVSMLLFSTNILLFSIFLIFTSFIHYLIRKVKDKLF